jgi:RNA polymerase sigma-70 factor (ECF subfamily)
MTAAFKHLQVDPDLLKGARRGDNSACEALFRQFQTPVYNLAFRICQCPDEAHDVLQDTFVQALTRIDQYHGPAPFWAWLRQISVNLCISRMRKLRRLDFSLVDAEAALDRDPGMQMDLSEALTRLPAEARTVIWLYDVEGYSHKEIAAMFGRSISFSKTQVSRARERLRDWLEPTQEDRLCPNIVPSN